MRLGVLTGGGDCPGLNAAIRSITHRAWMLGDEVVGFREGWAGLLGEGNGFVLTAEDVGGILHLGGTILGSSRTNPARKRRRDAPGGGEPPPPRHSGARSRSAATTR